MSADLNAPVRSFTRGEVAAAFERAVAEVEGIAGEDAAIDLIARLATGQPSGDQPFTRDQVIAAWNAAADAAKDVYNPGEVETSDTIRSDSCGDLIANLAAGFLGNPAGRDTGDVIAEQWHDLEMASFDGFEVWTQHVNDLGDHCPWSGQQATPQNREALMSGLDPDDDRCPQGCRASALENPPEDSSLYKAAIVATVKGWVA
jgi:hypothetical protein